jgi:glycosyltransferase involved in cell wall biosynthesis
MDMRTINLVAATHEVTSPEPGVDPIVEIVVPVFNEAHVLKHQMHLLNDALTTCLPVPWRITIADNGSTDGTGDVAAELAAELDTVASIHLNAKGRGRALRAAWTASRADVVAYTDVDLSTDVAALVPLIASVLSGHAEIAIGSRLSPGSKTDRGFKRDFISRAYNRLLHIALGTRFRDAQCGFKAIRADVARALLPEVIDQAWFFDTELLVRAERHGLRVVEIPVDWVDDPDSRVEIVPTAREDLRGIWRILRDLGPRRGLGPIPADRSVRSVGQSEAA